MAGTGKALLTPAPEVTHCAGLRSALQILEWKTWIMEGGTKAALVINGVALGKFLSLNCYFWINKGRLRPLPLGEDGNKLR